MAQRFNISVKHTGGADIHVFPDVINLAPIIGHRYALAARAKDALPADTFINVTLAGCMWEAFGRQGHREKIAAPQAADIFFGGGSCRPQRTNHSREWIVRGLFNVGGSSAGSGGGKESWVSLPK